MQLTSGAFKSLRFAGALLLLSLLAVFGLVYWTSIQQKERYLNSRNFRLLTILATQTQNVIDGQARIFQGTLSDERYVRTATNWDQWLNNARPLIPSLQNAIIDNSQSRIKPEPSTTARYSIDTRSGGPWLSVAILPQANTVEPILHGRMLVASLLEPIFAPKLNQGAFDTLVFASQDGHVTFATGRRRLELQSTQLDTVMRNALGPVAPGSTQPGDKTSPGGRYDFQQYARTISVQDVVIAGVNYKMFVHPCCRALGDSTSTREGDIAHQGMIVAGFTESDALRTAALAVSPTVVMTGVVFLLLAVVGWPFLKLTLLGERQRVSVWDVVQLGACSVFGLALATIVLVTVAEYARLNAEVDDQLKGFAHALDDNLAKEMRRSYSQLTAMEQALRPCPANAYPNVATSYTCVEQKGTAVPETGPFSYETFALLGPNGFQEVKTAPSAWVPSRISVRGRQYFEAVVKGEYWRTAECPDGCVLESLWSWTTGVQQAVLSKPVTLNPGVEPQVNTTRAPTSDRVKPDGPEAKYPVAALSIPMRSVIGPVMPLGYEFAIIDAKGGVLFHSDSQRNVQEDLFQETDNNRRLRAMVAGHSSGPLSIPYWGRPYRAYVLPTGTAGWSVVTLFDKQATRALVLEWTMFSLFLLTGYIALWVTFMIAGLKMGASWLWPDPLRQRVYVALAGGYSVLLVVFGFVVAVRATPTVFWAGLGLPVCAWLMTFVALNRRPDAVGGTRRRPEPIREYAAAASLFLVVTGMVPGMAFVARSYDLYIESYVRQHQLGIAQAVSARPKNDPDGLDRYFAFFSHTSLTPSEPGSDSLRMPEAGARPDVVLSLLEEYLPYFDESSVDRRELMHDRADDASWVSQRTDGWLSTVAGRGPGQQLVVRSTLPSLVAFGTNPTTDGHTPTSPVMTAYVAPLSLIGVMALAYGFVVFMLRHVFLSQVAEPLWASARLVATSGDNLLVICDPPAMAARIQGASVLELGAIGRDPNPATAWRHALMKINSTESGATVVTDIDDDVEDLEITYSKLELLEELVNDPSRTIVVLSKNPPAILSDSVRRAQPDSAPDKARWTQMLKAFVVLDWRDAPVVSPVAISVAPSRVSGWRRWIPRIRPAGSDSALRTHEALLSREGQPDRFLRRICDDIRESDAFKSGFLTREQILDEIEERASGYYRRVWESCSDDEKVVLGHVALVGLANAASRRVVRRLLVRRLLTKDPDLRLMNRTFRLFVLSPANRAAVVRLEGMAEPSTWDRLRLPLVILASAAGVFLYTTQRDVFTSTVAMVGGVTTAVPAIVRALSLIAQRQQPTTTAGTRDA